MSQELRDAENLLFASGHTDEGLAVAALREQLKTLIESLRAGPVCPHCHKSMSPVRFKGYYDEMCYWKCACEDIPGARTQKGAYA